MKNTIPILIIIAAFVFVSCNGNSSKTEDHSAMNHTDSMPIQQNQKSESDIKYVPAVFSNVDPAVAGFMKTMVQHYLEVKNALIENNSSGAASASEKILTAMKAFDKSLLSADQKKVYDDIEADLKEHAEHISKNKVEHQREHFTMMSKDMYDIVKAFGAGMTLYHDHCPMYKDGSMWLSETKEIRNPYYGDKMMTCGSVEEMFK